LTLRVKSQRPKVAQMSQVVLAQNSLMRVAMNQLQFKKNKKKKRKYAARLKVKMTLKKK